jgi:hypothetical protein
VTGLPRREQPRGAVEMFLGKRDDIEPSHGT